MDANGLYRTVEYTADSEYGFRAKVRTNEPGMDAYYLGRYSGRISAKLVFSKRRSPVIK